jgi:hypothetical protein
MGDQNKCGSSEQSLLRGLTNTSASSPSKQWTDAVLCGVLCCVLCRQVFKYMAEDGLPDESCLHYAATVSTSCFRCVLLHLLYFCTYCTSALTVPVVGDFHEIHPFLTAAMCVTGVPCVVAAFAPPGGHGQQHKHINSCVAWSIQGRFVHTKRFCSVSQPYNLLRGGVRGFEM